MRKVREPDARDGWYEFDPSDAAECLKDTLKNRPLKKGFTQAMARAIKSGAWVENGESIVLGPTGRVIDGQHRLTACIQAERPIVAYVVHLKSVTDKIFDSIDQGKSRNLSDRLALDGVPNSVMAAAITTTLHAIDNAASGQPRGYLYPVKIPMLRKLYEKERDCINRAALLVGARCGDIRGWMPASILGGVLAAAMRAGFNSEMELFYEGVTKGVSLPKGSPLLALRSNLQSSRLRGAQPRSDNVLALTIKAWNLHIACKSASLLKWSEVEAFPIMETSA